MQNKDASAVNPKTVTNLLTTMQRQNEKLYALFDTLVGIKVRLTGTYSGEPITDPTVDNEKAVGVLNELFDTADHTWDLLTNLDVVLQGVNAAVGCQTAAPLAPTPPTPPTPPMPVDFGRSISTLNRK